MDKPSEFEACANLWFNCKSVNYFFLRGIHSPFVDGVIDLHGESILFGRVGE